MKFQQILATLPLLLALNAGGQTANNVSNQKPLQVSATQVPSVTSQEQTIWLLQIKIQGLQQQIERMEKDNVSHYEFIEKRISDSDNAENRRLNSFAVLLTLLGVVLGVAAPLSIAYIQNKNIDKKFEAIEKQLVIAKYQANQTKQAHSDIEQLKKQVDDIKTSINKDKEDAKQAAKQAKASQLFTQAYSEKDFAKKIELYTQAIDNNPQFAEAYNNRGNAKYNIKDYPNAIQDYDKAIEINPQSAEAYNNRGNAKTKMKDYLTAIQDYSRAIEINPQLAKAYYNRGIAKYNMGDDSGALEDYNKAIEINPNYADPYNNRAFSIWLKRGELDKALVDVNIAIEKDNTKAAFYDTRGEVYTAMGKYKEALRDFSHAISLDDKDKEFYEHRTKCYRKIAEAEQDETKKAKLIAKAEADEEKAKRL